MEKTEAEIIVIMRQAIDVLKKKYQEAEGPWILSDFLSLALHPEKDHWMQIVLQAEELSQPYMEHGNE